MNTTTDQTVRAPTDTEWTHEIKRVNELLSRHLGDDPWDTTKLEATILSRANKIGSAQKLYNFIRALEDQNIHRENEKVIAIFESQFGPLPNA